MHLIIYSSTYTQAVEKIDRVLNDIVESALERNERLNITGVLFYHQGSFLQAIEGSQGSLEELMDLLEKDPRHKNIVRLVDQPIAQRHFDTWRMNSFNLDDSTTLEIGELSRIRDAYKANFVMQSDDFIQFLQGALQDRDFH